jgi:hypothetical protein
MLADMHREHGKGYTLPTEARSVSLTDFYLWNDLPPEN